MEGSTNRPADDRAPAAPVSAASPGLSRASGQAVYNPPSLIEPAATEPAPLVAANDRQPAAEPADSTGSDGGFYRPNTAAPEPAQLLASPESYAWQSQATYNQPATGGGSEVSWVSSGETLQSHTAGWRVRMTLAAIILAGLVYLITRDLVPSIVVVCAGLFFGFFGARKPAAINYRVDDQGITIGLKQYRYAVFRAFSVIEESNSLVLMPLQRFSPLLYVRLDTATGAQVVEIISSHLPLEQVRHDAVDGLLRRFKF